MRPPRGLSLPCGVALALLLSSAFPPSASAISSTGVWPSNDLANGTGTYWVYFILGATHSVSQVVVQFPPGFIASPEGVRLLDSVGLLSGTFSWSGSRATYTFVTSVKLFAGRIIGMALAGIKAPNITPSSAQSESFNVVVSTYLSGLLLETASTSLVLRHITGADIATSSDLLIHSVIIGDPLGLGQLTTGIFTKPGSGLDLDLSADSGVVHVTVGMLRVGSSIWVNSVANSIYSSNAAAFTVSSSPSEDLVLSGGGAADAVTISPAGGSVTFGSNLNKLVASLSGSDFYVSAGGGGNLVLTRGLSPTDSVTLESGSVVLGSAVSSLFTGSAGFTVNSNGGNLILQRAGSAAAQVTIGAASITLGSAVTTITTFANDLILGSATNNISPTATDTVNLGTSAANEFNGVWAKTINAATLSVGSLALTGGISSSQSPFLITASTGGAGIRLEPSNGAGGILAVSNPAGNALTLANAALGSLNLSTVGANGINLNPGGLNEVTVAPGGPVTVAAGGFVVSAGLSALSGGVTSSGGPVSLASTSTATITAASGSAASLLSGAQALISGSDNTAVTVSSGPGENIVFSPNNVAELTIAPGGPVRVAAGGLTVDAGGVSITAGGLGVSAGGITDTGNVGITGTVTASGLITANGGITLGANQNLAESGTGSITVGTGGVTSSSGNLKLTGASTVVEVTGAGGLTVDSGGLTVAGGITTPSGTSLTVTAAGAGKLTLNGDTGPVTVQVGGTNALLIAAASITGPAAGFTVQSASDQNLLVQSQGTGTLTLNGATGPVVIQVGGTAAVSVAAASITGPAAAFTVQSANNQNLLVQSQGTGTLTLNGATGPVVVQVGGTAAISIAATSVTGPAAAFTVQSGSNQNLLVQSQGTGTLALNGATGPLALEVGATTQLSVATGGVLTGPAASSLTLQSGSGQNLLLLSQGAGTVQIDSSTANLLLQIGGTTIAQVSGAALLPGATTTYDLGSAGLKWNNLYVATINAGSLTSSGSLTLSNGGTHASPNIQTSAGDLYMTGFAGAVLNAATGSEVDLRVNDVNVGQFQGGAILLAQPVTLAAGKSLSESGAGSITAGTGGITSSAGNLFLNGASNLVEVTGTSGLTVDHGETISAGGLTVTAGGATVAAGDLSLGSGNVAKTGASELDITSAAAQNVVLEPAGSAELTVAPGGPVTVVAGGLVVAAGGATINGLLTANNGITLAANQNLAESGTGSITVGTGGVTSSAGNLKLTGASTVVEVTGAAGLLVDAGGVTVTAGGVTVSAGGISAVGQTVNVGAAGTFEFSPSNTITFAGGAFTFSQPIAASSLAGTTLTGTYNIGGTPTLTSNLGATAGLNIASAGSALGTIYVGTVDSGSGSIVLRSAATVGQDITIGSNTVSVGALETTLSTSFTTVTFGSGAVVQTSAGNLVLRHASTVGQDIAIGSNSLTFGSSLKTLSTSLSSFTSTDTLTLNPTGSLTLGGAATTTVIVKAASGSAVTLKSGSTNLFSGSDSTQLTVQSASGQNLLLQSLGAGTLTLNSNTGPFVLEVGGTTRVSVSSSAITVSEAISSSGANLLLNAPTGNEVDITVNSANVAQFSGTAITLDKSVTLASGVTLPSGTLFAASTGGTSLTSGSYYSLYGVDTSGSATQGYRQFVAPTKGVIKNLYFQVATAPGGGNSWILTVYDGATNTGITCSFSGGGGTSCNDLSHTYTVNAGDLISWRVTSTGTPNASGNSEFSLWLVPSG